MLAALCCCRRTTGATAEATNEQVTPAEWETPELLTTRIEYDAIELIRRLSRGTSREVWLGQFRDEHVAVKRLVSEEGSVKDAMEFAAEIGVMARLDHPKIVHFVGVAWKSTFKLQAAVEFMDSGDVRTLLESNQVVSSTWTNLKYQIAVDVADALAYLHTVRPNVIYRNLKARNVLVDTNRGVKLSIFSIGARHSYEETMTAGVGTVQWTAPEVMLGEDCSESSDIYSFGALLSELDTAKIPFQDVAETGESQMQIAELVARGEMRPSFQSTCPEPIEKLARACLSFDPDERPSALEISRKLRQIAIDNDGMFLADATFSSGSGAWQDPHLTNARISADDLVLSERLASSELCEIWLGRWREREVAVKKLAPTNQHNRLADSLATRTRDILATFTSSGSLKHPNIVEVIGVSWTKIVEVAVVMELLTGASLRSLLDSDQAQWLTWAETKCQIAIGVIDVLAFVQDHEKMIPYTTCLVSSRNILLDGDGAAKLNLMQFDADTLQKSAPSSISLRYVAPEVLTGDVTTSSAFIYSFGLLLAELDSTRPPFEGISNPNGSKASDAVILSRIAKRELQPTLTAECPDSISSLARECLSFAPEKRPSAQRVAYKLRSILKDEL